MGLRWGWLQWQPATSAQVPVAMWRACPAGAVWPLHLHKQAGPVVATRCKTMFKTPCCCYQLLEVYIQHQDLCPRLLTFALIGRSNRVQVRVCGINPRECFAEDCSPRCDTADGILWKGETAAENIPFRAHHLPRILKAAEGLKQYRSRPQVWLPFCPLIIPCCAVHVHA